MKLLRPVLWFSLLTIAVAIALSALSSVVAVPPAAAGANINGDGKVNIFDLVMVGANFGTSAPGAWHIGRTFTFLPPTSRFFWQEGLTLLASLW